ncbi:MAG: polysaccharide pyruvyl transferase family protein [Actinobacteria bacterium]|nr:polysaccharide pyruvyl transferase family protein [Actinomycetota bacterium]
MTTIGVSGSYGGLNVGDEAILTSIVNELGRLVPDVDVVVFSRDAQHTERHHDVEKGIAVRDATRDEVVPEVERLDLLLLGGGGILYDGEAHNYVREVRLAQERGIPTMAYAIGAGPLRGREDRLVVREVLDHMEAVTVRDAETKRLLEEVGVRGTIEVTADPALLLTPVPFTEEMLEREGLTKERRLVGMSVREPGGAAPGLEQSPYHQTLANAADFMVDRFDVNVVFVPMERADVAHAHRVMAEMAEPARATVLQGRYGPRQLLGLMEHFELAVGMRLHFLIFAALAAVPVLGLPYASKVVGLFEALDLPAPSTLQRHSGPLLAALDRLWDSQDDLREVLRERVPSLQERARQTSASALALLDKASAEAETSTS